MAPSQPLNLLLSPTNWSPTGTTAQEETALEWVYLHYQCHDTVYFTLLAQLVNQGSTQCQQFHGFGPCCIILPLTNNQFSKGSQNSVDFQISFSDYYARIKNHYLDFII